MSEVNCITIIAIGEVYRIGLAYPNSNCIKPELKHQKNHHLGRLLNSCEIQSGYAPIRKLLHHDFHDLVHASR